MLVNGTQNLQLAGWAPGGVHLRPGGRAGRERRAGGGRKCHFRLLALDHPADLCETDPCVGIMGDNGPMDNYLENPVTKGWQLASAGIHEHFQGGPQPGRPLYIAP